MDGNEQKARLYALATVAAVAHEGYHNATAQLRNWEDAIKFARMPGNGDQLEDSRKLWSVCNESCNWHWRDLAGLSRGVIELMPDVAKRLKFVRLFAPTPWHFTADFAWDGALAELHEIQVEAIHRAAQINIDSGIAATSGDDGGPIIDQEIQAIAMLLDPEYGPNCKKIAEALVVPRSTLRGWQKFMARYDQLRTAAKTRRASLPRGSKHEGDVEAWDDEE